MNAPEIENLFEKLRKAGHGSLIKFDAFNSGESVDGIIFEPIPQRPPGYESGIFVSVPSDLEHIYYFDPEASREQGRLVVQVLDSKRKKSAVEPVPDEFVKEYEHLRRLPEVKMGGGATGEANSRHKGVVELG